MSNLMKANWAGYKKAADLLRAGELVVLPTDTVYGLAGLASNKKAVAKIFAVKNRPQHKALSVVIFAPDQAKQLVRISQLAQNLMDAFWPGALTLVLPTLKGADTLALRCPDVSWTRAFLDIGFEGQLVLPSANISGDPAPITAQQVMEGIGDEIPLILDGGTCEVGQESTIVSVEGDRAKLLRIGAIPPERLADFEINTDFL